jgi:hypothetical protein
MFWNFVSMVLHMFPKYLEIPGEEMQCFTQMLKFCELDQISILDEVVVGA